MKNQSLDLFFITGASLARLWRESRLIQGLYRLAVERGVIVPDLELGFCVIDNVFQSVKSAAETKSNPSIVPGQGGQAIQQSLAIANKGLIHICF